MELNGRSTILLDDTGAVLPPCASWMPPRDKAAGQRAEYFGWMGQDGFSTVKVEDVMAVFPEPQRRDLYCMMLHFGVRCIINAEDAFRLMKRMGWTEPTNTPRV